MPVNSIGPSAHQSNTKPLVRRPMPDAVDITSKSAASMSGKMTLEDYQPVYRLASNEAKKQAAYYDFFQQLKSPQNTVMPVVDEYV